MGTRLQPGKSMSLQHFLDGNADLADLSYVRHRIRAAEILEYLAGNVLALSSRRSRLQEGEELFASIQRGEVQAPALRADSGHPCCRCEAHRPKNQGRGQQQKNALQHAASHIYEAARGPARVLGPLDRRAASNRHTSPFGPIPYFMVEMRFIESFTCCRLVATPSHGKMLS